jgi:hypothetical protein
MWPVGSPYQALRDDAAEHGDILMAAICEEA